MAFTTELEAPLVQDDDDGGAPTVEVELNDALEAVGLGAYHWRVSEMC